MDYGRDRKVLKICSMNMKIIIILLFYATGWGTTIYRVVLSSKTTYDNEKWPINANAHSFWAVVTM